MAVTLTKPEVADEGLVHVSFPILKWEQDEDGDLVVKGIATDGSVDHDEQIVDPQWSARALDAWISSGGNVRMAHNAQRPVGKGLRVEVNKDGTDKHWVTSVIVDRDAQRLVKKGVLTAYSVGISRPVIRHDPSGRARGGVIVGGELAELSIVDRPSNKSSYLELAKAAADGTCEFTGKMFGADDDAIRKALDEPDVTKDASALASAGDFVNVDLPPGASISISPADFAALRTFKQQLVIDQHYDELALKAVAEAEAGVYKRDIDTATRRRLAADGKALPNLSYPIENAGDLGNAAHLARTGHGDVAAARRLIARRARELGVANPLDESDEVQKSEMAVEAVPEPAAEPAAEKAEAEPEAVKEAEPDVTKDPEHEPDPKPKPVKKAKKKAKKMPPWLKGDNDDDDDGKGGDDKDDDSSCKSAHAWEITDPVAGSVECSKCHTSPAAAANVTASQMDPAPVGELMESQGPASTKGATPASASGAVAESMAPVPAHREPDGDPAEEFEADAGMSGKAAVPDLAPDPEVAALIRFKTLGVDEDLGRLHDLTCPAYSPEMAAKYHPYADLPGLIDSGAWQRKTLASAAGPLDQALKMQDLWQAVHTLKSADQAALNDYRAELHKAFRDANPGPATYPTPGRVSPQSYHRPCLTDGRAAEGVDYGAPNSAPQVASSAPNAQSFDRPPLSSGHQSPSPSFMKGGGAEYPSQQGVPTRISYEQVERDKARRSLSMLHDHLNHMFPSMCPMLDQDAYRQPESRPVPQAAGIGKAIDPEPAAAAPAAAFKAEPEQDGDFFSDAEVYKGFKKMRKKLGKKVLSGSMTVDEARAKLGRQFAQKGTEEPQEAVQKAAKPPPPSGPPMTAMPPAPPVAASFDPEVIKAAVAEATAPLLERLEKQQGEFTTKLAEQQRVIDAIADQPDPFTAAFVGLGHQPIEKSRRPAGVNEIAESAAQARDMIRRNLQRTYETHSNPRVREEAADALATFGVETAP